MAKPQIDPRGPRFGAAITATALAVTIYLGLDASTEAAAFALLLVLNGLFAIGAIFGTSKHPYAWLFKTFVRPRLGAPTELEDAAPPQFAQVVGLFVAGVGVVLSTEQQRMRLRRSVFHQGPTDHPCGYRASLSPQRLRAAQDCQRQD